MAPKPSAHNRGVFAIILLGGATRKCYRRDGHERCNAIFQLKRSMDNADNYDVSWIEGVYQLG